jgi:putative SOS response-associated peptidase YedK
MCGRFSLVTTKEKLIKHFRLKDAPELAPHYNIAPTQKVLIVRAKNQEITTEAARWGLIPSWHSSHKPISGSINARAETVATLPTFRYSFLNKRCIIPVTSFFEWKKVEKGSIPYVFYQDEFELLGFAGLYSGWQNEAGDVIESCAIITKAANKDVLEVHGRMPVILSPEFYEDWLNPGNTTVNKISEILTYPSTVQLKSHQVSKLVNKADNDVPKVLEKVE